MVSVVLTTQNAQFAPPEHQTHHLTISPPSRFISVGKLSSGLMNRFFAFLPGLLLALPVAAQPGNPLRRLLRHDTTAVLRQVLREAAAHRVQIIYTQIRRDQQGRPSFRSYTYRLRPQEYFYPASTVKLPTVAIALEQLNGWNCKGIPLPHRESPLRIDSAFAGQTRVLTDSTAPGGRPSIGQYVRKVLLVSDNDAYNRLYEWVGQGPLNERLPRLGLRRTRIIGRLAVGDKEPGSRHTNPFTFWLDSAGQTVVSRYPAQFNAQPLPPLRARRIRIGQAYMEGEKRIGQPFDFSTKNAFPLREQQQVLRALLFPESLPWRRRFQLEDADHAFLRRYLSLPPRLSQHPRYDPAHYPDNYAKYLLVGGPPAALPEGVRIYNKIGQSYGFLIDNACIVDSLRGVEFMLAAVVYANADGVLNDDRYEYDAVALPFLRRLGQLVYQYELTRTDERRRRQVQAYWSARHERAE